MEKNYLDGASLKKLIHKVTTGIDPESRENQALLGGILPSFHAYVDAVVLGETELLLNPGADGKAYREMVTRYDQARHSCHETAIINVRVLNRLAELYELPPVFLGDSGQRHQVAAFCQELDAYLFANRRMKLS